MPIDLGKALGASTAAIAYGVSQRLRALYPSRPIIEGDACPFDLLEFAAAGRCTLAPGDPATYNQLSTGWSGPGKGVSRSPENVWYAVDWEGATFDVLLLTWPVHFRDATRYWILAETTELAERLFVAVCEFDAVVQGSVLVYDGGGWQKSKALYEAIRGATFDNLVLAGTLKDQVRGDIERFFSSRETYERFGVPWKRGILLLGPPGNGKTHTVKALINSTGASCLYVKSFTSQHATDHDNIRSVFQRARQTTPCFLVLEDLDSLINDRNRSFFLNELDGFAANIGIVTLATTNHPERLDTAIVDRPSRFDRKYHFDLPEIGERHAYISMWNAELQPDLRLTAAGIDGAAMSTDGFSFAYLKELFLTSLMAWINAPADGAEQSMDRVIVEQAGLLRAQMASMNRETPIALDISPDAVDE